jgi:hypothetical protein
MAEWVPVLVLMVGFIYSCIFQEGFSAAEDICHLSVIFDSVVVVVEVIMLIVQKLAW